jgi:hypothetical protein
MSGNLFILALPQPLYYPNPTLFTRTLARFQEKLIGEFFNILFIPLSPHIHH